ncbi:MAG: signal peptidase I [Alphaproteobacteria bacterium]|nr:signal peptidase I [Alphaproteobacteria bacterium]
MTDTPSSSPSQTEKSRVDGWGETIRTIIYAMLIALVIRTFAYEPFNIPSSSMVPTLLIGDFLFVSKYSYGYGSTGTFWRLVPFSGRVLGHEPKRGDVVVFKTPRDNSTDYIKRLIGLPGDQIQVRQGLLYINGIPVERTRQEPPASADSEAHASYTDYEERLPDGVSHIIREEGDDRALDNTDVFTVPPRRYFFMGDNRDNSQDSRTTTVGFVPEENLVGQARFLFFSLDENARFWQFWKWPWAVRWNRVFTKIK